MQDILDEIAPQATAAQKAIRELQEAAFRDRLTPLLNGEALSRLAASRDRRPAFGVIFMDLSGFKAINDAYGHEAGDAALNESGRAIQKITEQRNLLAFRQSGDEFVVVADDARAARDCAKEIAATFSAGLKVPYETERGIIELPAVRGAVGVCIREDSNATMKALIDRADSACRFAKFTQSPEPVEWSSEQVDDEVLSERKSCASCRASTTLLFRKKTRTDKTLTICANCGAPLS